MNYWDQLMGDSDHAASYMQTYGEGPGFETRHVVGSFISNSESVLDAGCGPGWNLDHFMEYGPKISKYKGIDYSKLFVEAANERSIHKQFPGAPHFSIGDIRKLQEPAESWDVVILQDCLEHTNGYKEAVTEALRVARKRVIITFWHLEGNEGTEHINDDGDDGYGAWYDKTLWESFLNSLPYVWYDTEVAPEGKNHKWNFYIIEKETE